MPVLKKILHSLNGWHYPQEYLCLAKEQLTPKLYAYLIRNKVVAKEVTAEHVFAGYCPLLFALASSGDMDDTITVCMTSLPFPVGAVVSKKALVAQLRLKKVYQQKREDTTIAYYEGIWAKHHFLSRFQQYIISINNQWYNKKEANVFLNNNLYKQVQVAYALPRTISLVTVRQNDLFNLFPTDLHGPVNELYYIISLRHMGKACAQVEAVKRIVLTNVSAGLHKEVYRLGKNHMQPMKVKEQFPFSEVTSARFHYPLPVKALEYKELELQDSFTYGIHKLLLFKIINQQKITEDLFTLAHIHNSYATWRYKHGLESNYLLR